MAGDALDQIGTLMRQGNLAEVIDLCQTELRARTDPKNRPHVITALCTSLSAMGRIDDAAVYYDRLRGELHAVGGKFYVAAAMAARHAEDIQRRFRESSELYKNQPVGFSSISSIETLSNEGLLNRRLIDPPQLISTAAAGRPAYTTDPFYCTEVPSGEFVTGWDFVFAEGRFLIDSGYNQQGHFYGAFPSINHEDLKVIAHVWPSEVEDIPHTALFLSAPHSFHVGHFIVDFLPRLRCLDGYGAEVKIALPRETPPKLLHLLSLFGIGDERLIFCDLGKRYRFRMLIVAQTGSEAKPNPKHIAFLRSALALPPNKGAGARRLFLHRGIGTRQIANRAEVDAVFNEFHIERIDLQTLDIRHQRELFANSELITGIYGSDLLACIFVPAGAHAIEFIWKKIADTTIGPWCRLSGLRTQVLMCDAAAESAQRRMKKDRDIVVDCDELRARLRAIFEPQSR